jgi:hypothetical protein
VINKKLLAVLVGYLISIQAYGSELLPSPVTSSSPETISHRSTNTDKFWLSANLGHDPKSATGVGSTFRTDFSGRIQFSRWLGLLLNYHQESVSAGARHGAALAENSIFGIGPAFRVLEIGNRSRFWRGSHLLVHALFQYGRSSFSMSESGPTDGTSTTLAEGTQQRTGFSTGADLFFPIYFGIWANAGLGIEANNFTYPEVHERRGDTMTLSATIPYFRLGMAYSF